MSAGPCRRDVPGRRECAARGARDAPLATRWWRGSPAARIRTGADGSDAGSSAPAVAGGGGGHRRYHTGVVGPSMTDAEKVAAVREALPAVGAGLYLDTPVAGP